MAKTCPQNILFYRLHSKISLRLRHDHNIPQASNETFCSRGTEIRLLHDCLKDQMILPSYYSYDYQLIIISLGCNVNEYGDFKSSYL